MTIENIYEFLNEKFPVSTAADFDNPGFLIGDKTADVKSAVLALDCSSNTVKTAIDLGANLIITHHPVIFKGLKSIKKGDVAYSLIENGISVISMHTNLDIAPNGVNDALAEKLELTDIHPIIGSDGFTSKWGLLPNAMRSDDFAAYVGKKLDTAVKYVGESVVKKVAVCGGSGSDLIYDAIGAGCDAFVTAEVKHNVFLDAFEHSFTLVDAGHFPTENVVLAPLKDMLDKQFPHIRFIIDNFSPIKVCINI